MASFLTSFPPRFSDTCCVPADRALARAELGGSSVEEVFALADKEGTESLSHAEFWEVISLVTSRCWCRNLAGFYYACEEGCVYIASRYSIHSAIVPPTMRDFTGTLTLLSYDTVVCFHRQ